MDKINKIFIGKIKSINEGEFTVEAVASDESIDRYQEVIKADAYKKRLGTYKKHAVLLSSHDYGRLTSQIGQAKSIRVKDGELVANFKYFVGEGNAEADWAWKLASKYGMAAFSVGFIPHDFEQNKYDDPDVKSGKKPIRTFTDVELLEISQVLVPANSHALRKSLEEFAEDSTDDISNGILKDYFETVLKSFDEEEKEEEILSTEEKEVEEEVIEVKDEEEIYMKELLEQLLVKFEEMKKEFDVLKDTVSLVDQKVGDIFEKGLKEEVVVVVEEKEVLEEVIVEKEVEDTAALLAILDSMNVEMKKVITGQSDKD